MAATLKFEFLPLWVLDAKELDRIRIKKLLESYGFLPLDDDVIGEMRDAIGELADEDQHVFGQLLHYIKVDYQLGGKDFESTLRALVSEYESAPSDGGRIKVEGRMMAATKGQPDHPDWYQHACLCNSCCSYG